MPLRGSRARQVPGEGYRKRCARSRMLSSPNEAENSCPSPFYRFHAEVLEKEFSSAAESGVLTLAAALTTLMHSPAYVASLLPGNETPRHRDRDVEA